MRPALAYFSCGQVAVAFRHFNTLGIRDEYSFRGCFPHGPHVHVPTHRRPRRRARRKARYRLGRLSPSPDGFRTRWTTYRIS